MADPQQMTFDSAPVKQDTPVPQSAPSGGMVFDAAPVTQDTLVSQTQSKTPPNNVYAAAPDEQTPEGSAAAIARRQAEHPILAAIGEGSGEALGDIWDAVKGLPGGILHSLPPVQFHDTIKQAVPIFQAYEQARSSGKGVWDSMRQANEVAKQHDAAQQALQTRIDEFKKKPGAATVRAIANAATVAATIYDGGALSPANTELPAGVAEANAAARTAAESTTAESAVPEAESQPGIVQQIVKGKKVAQPGAEAAVRKGVQSSTEAAGTADESVAANIENQPVLKGNQSIVDEPLSALKEKESALYKKVDDAVGFDLKAEKAQLANDKYKLSQLGNTDADITQRGNLTEAINDSTDRIAQAEAKLKDAGIDPKAADAAHQQRMAGQDFKKALVKNTNSDGSINVDGFLKDAKNLRFSKYGDRLGQFMGNNGADAFVSKLEQMQKLGAHAMKTQQIAVWLGKYVLPEVAGGALATGYALSK